MRTCKNYTLILHMKKEKSTDFSFSLSLNGAMTMKFIPLSRLEYHKANHYTEYTDPPNYQWP